MKKYSCFWSLLTMMLFIMASVHFVSCGDDKENEEYQLSEESKTFVGYWHYISHEKEIWSMMHLTEKGIYQISSQHGTKDSEMNGGTFSYDAGTKQLRFTPGTAFSMSPFSYNVVNMTGTKLLVNTPEGQIEYEKVSDWIFPNSYHWGNPWYLGTWKHEIDDEISLNRYDLYTFRVDGTAEYEYNHWGTTHNNHFSSYAVSSNYFTLTYDDGSTRTLLIKSHTDDSFTIEKDDELQVFIKQ